MRAYAIELDPPLDDVSAGVPRRPTTSIFPPNHIGVAPSGADVSGESSGPQAGLPSRPAGSLSDPIPACLSLTLSASAGAILRLAAAHDGVSESELVTRLVCQHADRVGLPALLKGGP